MKDTIEEYMTNGLSHSNSGDFETEMDGEEEKEVEEDFESFKKWLGYQTAEVGCPLRPPKDQPVDVKVKREPNTEKPLEVKWRCQLCKGDATQCDSSCYYFFFFVGLYGCISSPLLLQIDPKSTLSIVLSVMRCSFNLVWDQPQLVGRESVSSLKVNAKTKSRSSGSRSPPKRLQLLRSLAVSCGSSQKITLVCW